MKKIYAQSFILNFIIIDSLICFTLLRALAFVLALNSGAHAMPNYEKETRAHASTAKKDQAPLAPIENHEMTKHGDTRIDPYFWMNKMDSKEVLKYLKQENKYFENWLKPHKKLKDALFKEMRSRLKDDDRSVPYKRGDYYYFTQYKKGQEYPVFYRSRSLKEKDLKRAQVILDGPKKAKGKKYFQLGSLALSPDGRYLAYAVDTVGRRFYNIYFRDLEKNKDLSFQVKNVTGSLAWANDNKTFFYVQQNPYTLRAEKIFRTELGSKNSELVYFEKDEQFHVKLSRSLNQKSIFIIAQQTVSTEFLWLDPENPTQAPIVFIPREKNHEYSVEDAGDRFFVVSNKNAKNFQVLEIIKKSYVAGPKALYKIQDSRVIIHDNSKIFIEDVTAFKDFFVVTQRQNGLTELVVYSRQSKKSKPQKISFKESAYVVSLTDNLQYETDRIRYNYQSLAQPPTVYDYVVSDNKSIFIQQIEVPHYDSTQYVTERFWAKARDGEKIPVSVLYKKTNGSPQKLKQNKLFVYGYGSYGYSMEPHFDRTVFSLVDRGFTYAILHIRGGSEMGRHWYEDGRLLNKKNTFNDFIDATEELVKSGYGQRDHIFAMGGSAGGLLMGAIANMRPDLYRGIVAIVPFVDVVTTMLDDTIPLTTFEYNEWGNPNDKKYYTYMKSYSPYDNVRMQAYPNIFIATGYHDSQVQYWEPAKWTAKLRTHNSGPSQILLRTDLEAGHSGASGRFKSLEEDALYYTFILTL